MILREDSEDVTRVCVCSYYQQKRRNVNREPGEPPYSRQAGLCLEVERRWITQKSSAPLRLREEVTLRMSERARPRREVN